MPAKQANHTITLILPAKEPVQPSYSKPENPPQEPVGAAKNEKTREELLARD